MEKKIYTEKDRVTTRLEYAINAIETSNVNNVAGHNYLIGTVDIKAIEQAIKYINAKHVTIVCSAVWYNDGIVYKNQPTNIEAGFVVCGRRHGNCFTTLEIMGKNYDNVKKDEVGFVTSDNRFVGRKEAFKIALEANQLLKPELHVNIDNFIDVETEILTSEDIFQMLDSEY